MPCCKRRTEFVEEFILDRTLTPAIREFGYQVVRMLDPTCGSGHFLLGGFYRMVDVWARAEPSRNRRDVAQKALDAESGVDLNPFAVAISRFRLLLAALQASDVQRLQDAPDFTIYVAIGDIINKPINIIMLHHFCAPSGKPGIECCLYKPVLALFSVARNRTRDLPKI